VTSQIENFALFKKWIWSEKGKRAEFRRHSGHVSGEYQRPIHSRPAILVPHFALAQFTNICTRSLNPKSIFCIIHEQKINPSLETELVLNDAKMYDFWNMWNVQEWVFLFRSYTLVFRTPKTNLDDFKMLLLKQIYLGRVKVSRYSHVGSKGERKHIAPNHYWNTSMLQVTVNIIEI
jgi:hypothetical protein